MVQALLLLLLPPVPFWAFVTSAWVLPWLLTVEAVISVLPMREMLPVSRAENRGVKGVTMTGLTRSSSCSTTRRVRRFATDFVVGTQAARRFDWILLNMEVNLPPRGSARWVSGIIERVGYRRVSRIDRNCDRGRRTW